MEKSKLILKKRSVSVLTNGNLSQIKGGGTEWCGTSINGDHCNSVNSFNWTAPACGCGGGTQDQTQCKPCETQNPKICVYQGSIDFICQLETNECGDESMNNICDPSWTLC
ncbi:MAG: hypothetical protein RLZZ292_2350 [Bacteroidota bacterium]|jgi:hypothetical protein